VFTTAADNQPSVEVHVLQGERKMAADNRTMANFGLDGIAAAPRGMPQIEVAFDIDANGIVHVSATDKATGKEQKVTIKSTGGLSDAEIQQMVADAKQHEAEDARRGAEIEERNTLEAMVHQAETLLAENGDKVGPELRGPVEDAVTEAKAAIEAQDADGVKAARAKLDAAAQAFGQAMYAGAPTGGPSAGPSAEPAPEEPEGDIIDADFEERDAS
jgi:molecular chaperone DnaK